MELLIDFMLFCIPASLIQKTQKDIRTVVFATNMRCGNCVKKVKENLSFAKGVKALDVSLEKQQITVTYDAAKTSVEELAKIVKNSATRRRS